MDFETVAFLLFPLVFIIAYIWIARRGSEWSKLIVNITCVAFCLTMAKTSTEFATFSLTIIFCVASLLYFHMAWKAFNALFKTKETQDNE